MISRIRNNIARKRLKDIYLYLILVIFCTIFCAVNSFTTKGMIDNEIVPDSLGKLSNSKTSCLQEKDNWWDISYKFRKPIQIINRDLLPLPKGYSINISINTFNLITTGRLRADGKDLRIVWYNSSDDTWLELDRINETKFNNVDTQIWFKTQTSIDPGENDSSYYLYYGYEDANDPPSNKRKIYDYYDDFTQPDGLAEGWTQTMGSSWIVVNNEYREDEGVNNRRTIINSYSVGNASIEIRLRNSGGTNFGLGVIFRYLDSNNLYAIVLGGWDREVGFAKWVDGSLSQVAISSTTQDVLIPDRWYNFRLDMLGSRYLIYLDGTLKINTTDTDHLSAGQFGLITYTTSTVSYFDDLNIKLLVKKNPVATIGIEETYTISDRWWDSNYKFRNPITIINRDLLPLPKDYSINISINTFNLITTGRLRADGKDLRIVWYNSSDDTWLELDRINETKFNNVDTQIWFKTQTSIDPGENDSSYYLYYGYGDANDPPSNKRKIYDYYDDFTQPDGPAEGWTQTMGSSWTVVNNEYREDEGVNNRRAIINSYSVGNASIEIRLKNSGGTNFGLGVIFRYLDSNNLYAIALGGWDREVGFAKWVDGSLSQVAISSTTQDVLIPDRWYNFRLDMLGSRYLIYLDGTLKINTTDTDHQSAGQFGLITYTTSTVSYFDDLKIKFLVSKVPSAILGIEETQSISTNNWWNVSYVYRKPLYIINNHLNSIPKDYSINVSSDTKKLISEEKLQSDGRDFRIAWYNLSNNKWSELDRINQTKFNSNDTQILFKTQKPIYPKTRDSNYYIYYGFEDADNPPTNKSKIYHYFDDFTQPDGPAEGWTNTNGTSWLVIDNEYRENDFIVDRRSILNSYTVENASIEINLKNSGGNFGAGVMFRYVDENNFYTAGIGFWEYETAIGKWVNNEPSILYNTTDGESVLIDNKWYILRIDALGSRYLVYLDGELKNTVIDTDHIALGQIGLITWTTSATSYFDNLMIKLLVANSPISTIGNEETYKPQFNYITESADPLELGEIENLIVNVTDLSGIQQTFIEIEDIIYSMDYIGDDLWQYNSWIPLNTGTHIYKIHCQNNNLKWNSITESINVIDTTFPSYSNLIENADPLELGSTELISIDVFDLSGISQVLINIEGINYTMTNIGGDSWQYDLWTPLSTGMYFYTIYMEDTKNNWNSVSDSIEVVDTTPPSYSDLVESADPLELGATEVISIIIYDISGINQVLIEIEEVNHTMTNLAADTWQYNVWIPSTTGTIPYTIHMEDMNSNWNFTINSIQVIDTTPPSYSNLVESADPLELGATEIIEIDIFDISGINQVLIEIEGVNYTMINIAGDTWQYDAWIPLNTGTCQYTIYMEDMNSNWNFTINSIQVIDTTPPSYSNLVESADPLELGATEIIEIDIFDISGINQVLIEIEGVNYTMINIAGDTWQYDAWTPSTTGTIPYTIHMEDMNNNSNSITDTITIVSTNPPSYSDLVESSDPLELGVTEVISINVYDDSGINQVLIEIEGVNYTMINIAGDTWQHDAWTPSATGTYSYTIYMEDIDYNWNSVSDTITVIDTTPPEIIINKPNTNDQFGHTPPEVNVEFFDFDIDTTWYQLTDGISSNNYTWFGNIDQNAWDMFGTGFVTINFYANDSSGNFASESVTIKKDITAPDIIINEPEPYDLFGKIAPLVDVDIYDPNLDAIWYELFNITLSIIDYTWTGSVEQYVWDEFKSDILTIRLYANDTLGNTRFLDLTIVKDVKPPDIIIHEPDPYDLFGENPPNMDISIFDDNLDEVWYQLSNDFETTENQTWIGNISQELWDVLGNGTVKIVFYANDTLSNFATQFITIRKDTIAPFIFVNYPSNYTVYGNIPPNIIISVDEPNIDSIWYQINNGTLTTGNYSWSGIIEQTVWNELGNGTLTIIFYSNDTVGNMGFKILIIRKDIIAPKIVIEKPVPYNLFGKSPPIINAEFYDPNLSYIWYQLRNGTIYTNNYTWTGIIEQSIWNIFGNGTIIINFYANDSLGNLGTENLLIHKDVIAPEILIDYPNPYDVFGQIAPDINVIINEKNLNSTWYQLKNGSLTTLNYTWTGSLEQGVWEQVGNGTVTFIFYANDLIGNFGYTEITILKDLSAPIINVIEPEDFAILGYAPPEFEIYISGIDIYNCWYEVSGNKYFFPKSEGITMVSINQTKWDEFSNGTIIIGFYVNDTVGNIGFDIITLRKDIFAPQVKINLPIYEIYWNKPPILNISYFDPNYDSLWYRIGVTDIKLINNTEQIIDPVIWSNLDQGEFHLYIFANDSAGNINDTYSYTLYKDTLAPLIIINIPLNNTYSNVPPTLNISCYDPNFDALWYSDGNINVSLNNNTNQALGWEIWNTLIDGKYQLIIYANDTFGHLNDSLILTIYKDTSAPEITHYSPSNNTIYNQPPLIDIYAMDPNLDTLWYEIGDFIGILQNHIGQEIDMSIWNILPQGKFQIFIYANDSFGYLNNSLILSLYKDTLAPRILINLPYNQTYWNSKPIINITVYDPNLDKLWYKIGANSILLENNTESLILDYVWNNLPEGQFIIEIFASDYLGHINDTYKLILYKDTLAPEITIIYPYSNCFGSNDAPPYNISINELNLDKVWYTLIGYPEDYTILDFTGIINQTAWNNFENGTVTIRFYANDTLGNTMIKEVDVRKDLYTPLVKINLPINQTIWDSPPIINISAFDSNLETIWYKIGILYSDLDNNIEQQVKNHIWINIPEGEFRIYFYANDSAGNVNNSYYLTLYKDTLAPNIIINSPDEYQEAENIAPYYDLTITDDNLDMYWYSLDYGHTNITIINTYGQINQELWNRVWESSSNGDSTTIRFYANDTLGHIGYQEVILKIKKPGTGLDLIDLPGFILTVSLGGTFGIAIIVLRFSKNYRRIDQKQKKKVNGIFYLALTLISLLLLSFFI